jgi:hypothetical protein
MALLALAACGSRLAAVHHQAPRAAAAQPAARDQTAVSTAPTARADAASPRTHTQRPALLAVGQELHLLVLQGEHVACQAWTVEDDPTRPLEDHALRLARRIEHAGRTSTLRYDYTWDAGRLALIGYNRKNEVEDELALGESDDCKERWRVTEHADSLDVGGSIWFAHASDCETAREAALPVATDFGACNHALALPDHTAADEGMRRFDTTLRQGGALYELTLTASEELMCERWTVRPERRGQAMGHLERVRREGQTEEITSYGYGWTPGTRGPGRGEPAGLALFGPRITRTTADHRSNIAYACMELASVDGAGRDRIAIAGNTVYLDRDACESAHRGLQARLRWLPPAGEAPGEPMARLAGQGIPGC